MAGRRQATLALRERPRWSRATALALVIAGACDEGSAPGAEVVPVATAVGVSAEPENADTYRSDPRIADLLAECAQSHFYDRDTSYLVPVLVEKLQRGYTEPLQRAKNELALLGPEAMEEVRRLAETWFTDPRGASYVQNALDVAVMSPEPQAREVVLRFLQHPRDALRRVAIRGMSLNHAQAEDFERLWIQLEAESLSLQEQLVPALYRADPEQAELLFLDWLEEERHQALWKYTTPLIAASTRPATVQRCRDLVDVARVDVRPFLLACLARAGDETAGARLRDELTDELAPQRVLAVQAAAQAELVELLLPALVDDPAPEVRRMAAARLAALEPADRVLDRLSEALADPDREVRLSALRALVAAGDEVATERALALLEGEVQEANDGYNVLRDRLAAESELADRARRRLISVDQENLHLELADRFRILKTIGAIPGAESARYLREVALANPGPLSKKRAHELLMIHASNSGEAGRAWLFDQLESETDPLRRLDLIWSATCYRSDGSRERLHELVDRPQLSPYELLFASELLARLGPSQVVAPKLKRICYRIELDEVRRSMRCLLWKWY